MDACLNQRAQPIETVPDVYEAGVQRREAESDYIRLAKIYDHVGLFDQRATDGPRLAMTSGQTWPCIARRLAAVGSRLAFKRSNLPEADIHG